MKAVSFFFRAIDVAGEIDIRFMLPSDMPTYTLEDSIVKSRHFYKVADVAKHIPKARFWELEADFIQYGTEPEKAHLIQSFINN